MRHTLPHFLTAAPRSSSSFPGLAYLAGPREKLSQRDQRKADALKGEYLHFSEHKQIVLLVPEAAVKRIPKKIRVFQAHSSRIIVPRRLFHVHMWNKSSSFLSDRKANKMQELPPHTHTHTLQEVVHRPEEASSIAHFPECTKCQRAQPLLPYFREVPAIHPRRMEMGFSPQDPQVFPSSAALTFLASDPDKARGSLQNMPRKERRGCAWSADQGRTWSRRGHPIIPHAAASQPWAQRRM